MVLLDAPQKTCYPLQTPTYSTAPYDILEAQLTLYHIELSATMLLLVESLPCFISLSYHLPSLLASPIVLYKGLKNQQLQCNLPPPAKEKIAQCEVNLKRTYKLNFAICHQKYNASVSTSRTPQFNLNQQKAPACTILYNFHIILLGFTHIGQAKQPRTFFNPNRASISRCPHPSPVVPKDIPQSSSDLSHCKPHRIQNDDTLLNCKPKLPSETLNAY